MAQWAFWKLQISRTRYYAISGEVVSASDLTARFISTMRAQHLGYVTPGAQWIFDHGKYRLMRGATEIKSVTALELPSIVARNARLAIKNPSRYGLNRIQRKLLMDGEPITIQDALGSFTFGVEQI